MAVRLYAETGTIRGVNYKIEIHDTDFVDSSTEFNVRGYGLKVAYTPDQQKRLFSPLMSSRLTFSMIVDDATKETFVEDLITGIEGRFSIAVYRDQGAGYVFWWAGDILPDGVSIEDTAIEVGYDVDITAVDGLANLKEILYTPGVGEPIDLVYGNNTFNQVILICLGKLRTTDIHYDNTDEILHVRCGWYATEHNLALIDNPLEYSRVKNFNFFKFSKTDTGDYLNCYQVLKKICEAWGARFYFSFGVWHFEQIHSRKAASNYAHKYNKGGTKLSEVNESHEIAVDKMDTQVLSGGRWFFLPALAKVGVKLAHDGIGNLLVEDWTKATPAFVYNQVYDEGTTRLQLQGNLHHFSSYTDTGINIEDYHRIIFKLRIKVGSYYLKRDYTSMFYTNPQYSPVSWTTDSNDYYYFLTDMKPNVSEEMIQVINITTPELEETGELTYDFDYHALLVYPNSEVTAGVGIIFTFENYLRVLPDGESADVETHKLYEAENDDEATKTLLLETNIGDGIYQNSNTKLQVDNGSTWEDSTGWQQKIVGTTRLFNNLLAFEIMSLRKEPRRIYNGTITSITGFQDPLKAHGRYTYDSKIYIFTGGTYTAKMEELQGTFIEVNETPTGISIPTTAGQPLSEYTSGEGPGLPVGLGTNTGSNTFETAAAATVGLETQTLSNTDEFLTEGDNITQIPIGSLPKTGSINTGDTITMVNSATGQTQSFTVTSDLTLGDTYIEVSSVALQYNFPTGSGVIQPAENAAAAAGGTWESFLSFSGTIITVTAPLPTTDIDRSMAVYRGGQKLIHNTHFTLDTGGGNNDVILTLQAFAENITVETF